MQQYKITPQRIKTVIRRILLISISCYIIAIALGIGKSYYDKEADFDIQSHIFAWGISALIFCGVLYFLIKSQKAILRSFTIIITNNTISREQRNTPTITMYLSEVSQIVKAKNGAFVVSGKDKYNPIIIDPQMENAADLEQALTSIMPITPTVIKPSIKIFLFLYIAALLATILYIFLGTNEIIINTLKVSIMCLVATTGVYMINNKNSDKLMKIFGWVILVGYALGIIYIGTMWLTGNMP